MKKTRRYWVPTSQIGSTMNLAQQIIAIPPAYGSIDINDSKQSLVAIYDSHACYCCGYWIPTFQV